MISDKELSSYDYISTSTDNKHMNVTYLLFTGNQFVERVIVTYNLRTGSISYTSSLSKSIRKKYLCV